MRLHKFQSVNGYATGLRAFPDGAAVFLKWCGLRGFSITNELHLLDLQSHDVTPLKVNGLN